ncbi:MAG: PP2C family protein-serine/threonine phosphatase [Solobacterium sp.]|nr:PP2C family protein-serine/threonine phosphatase [Solobacterium sp.]
MGKEKKERRKRSLENKAFWFILISALVLVLIIVPFELVMHAYTIMVNYNRESKQDLAYAVSLIDEEYLENLYAETKKRYEATPEELKQQEFTDDYRNIFIDLVDDQFLDYREILVKCREQKKLVNVYLILLDEKKERFVFVLDGDKPEYAYLPGQWLSNENGEIESFDKIRDIENSNWKLSITYGKLSGFTATNYYDITDTKGNQIGYGVIDFDVNDFFNKLFDFLKVYIPFLVAILFLGANRISKIVKKSIIVPVDALAASAKTYTARDKVNDSGATDYFSAVNINTDDEIEELWRAMVNMEEDMNDTMQRIREVTEEKLELKNRQERIQNELSIATRIQEGILPSVFPPFPERKEFDIYASMVPALEVGGDFYDFFLIDEDHLGIVMADVSGKGISGALFMVISKTLIQNETMINHGQPSKVLSIVNQRLLEGNEAEMFVTVWLGILTISTGEIVYVDAGHEYPAIAHQNGRFELFKDVHGMPVAALETTKFREGTIQLLPGDTMYLYTDGVTDANNPAKERFDTDRMLDALNINPNGTVKEINDNVHHAIREFMQDEPPFDDTTMLVFRYSGPDKGSSQPE